MNQLDFLFLSHRAAFKWFHTFLQLIFHVFPALLKILWVCPTLSGSGQGRCCCSVKRTDAPKNAGSPENRAAVAGVFSSQSGRPPLCLSGALLGWAPLVSLNTTCTRLHRSLKSVCWLYYHDSRGRFAPCPVRFAQMFDPFVLVLRQQQQLTQVSTVMSRTTTAVEQIKTALWSAHNLKKIVVVVVERRLTDEG